jgi:hypothetical protein
MRWLSQTGRRPSLTFAASDRTELSSVVLQAFNRKGPMPAPWFEDANDLAVLGKSPELAGRHPWDAVSSEVFERFGCPHFKPSFRSPTLAQRGPLRRSLRFLHEVQR